ncbi:hypothetical protein KI688_006162 [Linnemannia hyalina]|uniref:Chromo domain-containing protein n=1 Tax=Linnemannia hyalina TaxID=64524 RepID=A0A9P7Y446_9FUNG|nr:hypothetical protein KI688_006162 [Linnemannia hyalina]
MAKANASSAPNKGKRTKRAQSDDDFNQVDDSSNNNNNKDNSYEDDEDGDEDGAVDDAEYEVERVVGHKRAGRGRHGTLSYMIKWKGYDSDANSWVKGSDVNCPELVDEYWQRYEQAGGRKSDTQGDESNPAKRKAVGSSSRLSNRDQESSRGQAVAAKKRRIRSRSSDEYTADEPEEDGEHKADSDSRSGASERVNTEDKDDENKLDTEVTRTRRSTESNEQQISEIDEIEEYDDEEGGSWSPPEDWASWGNHIDYIRAIMQSNDTRLAVFLRWKNGRETTHDIEVAHEKFPLLLIRYYENHLRFLRIADQNP